MSDTPTMLRRPLIAATLTALALATSFCEENPPSHVPVSTGPVCEAISECGFWQGCAYLVPIEPVTSPARYRVAAGEAKGKVFVRKHSCSPAVGAGETCLEYCTGAASSVVCSDGLSADELKCDETARPQRVNYQCILEPNGDCVKSE